MKKWQKTGSITNTIHDKHSYAHAKKLLKPSCFVEQAILKCFFYRSEQTNKITAIHICICMFCMHIKQFVLKKTSTHCKEVHTTTLTPLHKLHNFALDLSRTFQPYENVFAKRFNIKKITCFSTSYLNITQLL